ncbi:GNAT family N-acetyltransferase [Halalkalibacterium halodurans]|uniref:GNAT family N-acetyltransferase n=1 Tax=Halalkalibacterium halodurans TaxID=86665 RepID=UPI002AA9BBE5|nr:GNAT family N-acetyltransferase [Halalkalibacterium halodurans]MDY7221549.1 GNAT family N-acetyltransferase [Halalkalibacterium halodurans]MDY7240825.1 GNAT family N-acetyltransferase [Halalkalibacterium halodurans]MED4164158.1 GNAT family N-acetyltransferase [Halalkalibacterium halodurans]
MLRPLTEKDREQLLAFAGKEPAVNLFIIGDVETFGVETEFQQIWGEFNERGELVAAMLRYFQSFLVYGESDWDHHRFAQIVNEHTGKFEVSGRSDIVERFENGVIPKLGQKRQLYLCELQSAKELSDRNGVQHLSVDDLNRLLVLHDQIDDFAQNDNGKEQMKVSMEKGASRTYYVEEDGKIIASASTAAENSRSAMIVGVCTHPDYRNQGLASRCMSALCEDLLAEGKTVCLFYDNPVAGRIYKRLGFKDIGRWTIYRS